MNILNEIKQQYKIGDMATKLIYWNIILFVVPTLLFAICQLFGHFYDVLPFFYLPSYWTDFLNKPWTIITYSFFHNNLLHIVFNMIMLHFVGRLFTTFFTQKQLFGVYLLGGIFGGILFILGYEFLPILSEKIGWLLGASASIMAILIATTVYQPDYNLRLALIGNVKLWQITLVFILIDLIQLPAQNSGGHLAHLGGAIFGFIYIKLLQAGLDLTSGVSWLLDTILNLFSAKKTTPFKKVHKNQQSKQNQTSSHRNITKDKTQQQIDEILDKISKSGYDSLTKDEKEFLFKAGK